MRVELLFLRWLLAIAMIALGIAYATSRQKPADTRYETIPLVHGGKSSGMPLAGILIDPSRRDISAIVGGPACAAKSSKHDFFIMWEGEGGQTYATTFRNGKTDADAVFEVSPTKQIRRIYSLTGETAGKDLQNAPVDPEAGNMLRSVLNALPPRGASAGQP